MLMNFIQWNEISHDIGKDRVRLQRRCYTVIFTKGGNFTLHAVINSGKTYANTFFLNLQLLDVWRTRLYACEASSHLPISTQACAGEIRIDFALKKSRHSHAFLFSSQMRTLLLF